MKRSFILWKLLRILLSVADACAVHGTDADELVEKLNAQVG